MSGPGRRRDHTARIFVLAIFVLLAAACGVPVNDEVQVLARDGHEELLDGTTTTTEPPPPSAGTPTKTVMLYFLGADNKLEVVQRAFPSPVTGAEVLTALEQGPVPAEAEPFEELGILTTLLPDGLAGAFGERNEETGVQRVNVDPKADFRLLDDVTRRLIVSQIVCTVLNLNQPGISGVEIFDGEEAIPLNDNDAEPIQGPAELADFDDCKTGTEERAELATTTTVEG